MELNPNQWHVKFYFWCLDVWDAFLDTRTYRHRSNLCQYIRTIFVWMPLALAVNIGFWVYTLYVLIYFPLTHFGVVGSVKGYLTVALIGGTILLCLYVEGSRREKADQATDIASNETVAFEKEEKGPGFIEVIWLYLVAMKQKVCPTIEFRADRTRESV